MEPIPILPNYSITIWMGMAILGIFLLILTILYFAWWMAHRPPSLDPYTQTPLRRVSELPYTGLFRLDRFMLSTREYENQMFNIDRAVFSRESGRVFPNAINFFGKMHVDWNFIAKRYFGHYVSWGSLSEEQKKDILEHHHSLEGFQTDLSSPNPIPRQVEAEYVKVKPGPLYVDVQSKVLVGWKLVPETDLEVLIVQKPISR